MLYINGMKIFSVPWLCVHVPPVKTWLDKVLEWNPCNPWIKQPTEKPSDPLIMGGAIYMHPIMIRELEQATGGLKCSTN